MSLEGIFINGVYPGVLSDIYRVHSLVPDQILYLQPFSGQRIVELSDNRPSADASVRLFLSLTDDLPTVRYSCEIVGWNDKRELTGRKREIIDTVIRSFQPTEEGVYAVARGIECVNLLSVWRMRELSKPFSVAELRKAVDDQPVSTKRQTAGGWVYVKYPTQEWLESRF
ncbi:MAG: 5-methylcytosine-specific restriction enzyme [Pyrinomonadaceae bacterium]|nr:5-methylcytosine-specific restriction enzyme [Pyrinomonadaceae bacterium]